MEDATNENLEKRLEFIGTELESFKDESIKIRRSFNEELRSFKEELRSFKEELRSHRETIEIKNIHILQFGLISGVTNAFIGIIFGILLLPLIGLLSAIPGVPSELLNILGGGVLIIVLLVTMLFFILGFIFGIIEVGIYNIVASMTGGIKVDI